ncbi:hypothetical protein SISNIDRAFT_469617 [Sistotremastrum niveocremeum HHB9708]|uniref:Uncharacterized protein n=1 Tax=Sistotremastrum niveocremeum HHB9708 TaxID=1314777 RepID=A0A164PXL5_9AGAM|nr:hypothetical protein SISNIDRAFT_469617 [Sistotremastrum niveocremeum HHB9708]
MYSVKSIALMLIACVAVASANPMPTNGVDAEANACYKPRIGVRDPSANPEPCTTRGFEPRIRSKTCSEAPNGGIPTIYRSYKPVKKRFIRRVKCHGSAVSAFIMSHLAGLQVATQIWVIYSRVNDRLFTEGWAEYPPESARKPQVDDGRVVGDNVLTSVMTLFGFTAAPKSKPKCPKLRQQRLKSDDSRRFTFT